MLVIRCCHGLMYELVEFDEKDLFSTLDILQSKETTVSFSLQKKKERKK